MQRIGSARGSCVNGTPALTSCWGATALRSWNFSNCSVSKKVQNHRSPRQNLASMPSRSLRERAGTRLPQSDSATTSGSRITAAATRATPPFKGVWCKRCRSGAAGHWRLGFYFRERFIGNTGASRRIPALGVESRCLVRPQDQFPASYHRDELQNEPHCSNQVRCPAPSLSWNIRSIVVSLGTTTFR